MDSQSQACRWRSSTLSSQGRSLTKFSVQTSQDEPQSPLNSSQDSPWAEEAGSVAVLPTSSHVSPAPSELSILAAYEYDPVIDPLQSPTSTTTDLQDFQEHVAGEDTAIPSCSEVELLKKALRTVIHQRDHSIEHVHKQNSVIRDFSLAVAALSDDRITGKPASNRNGQFWRPFWSTGGEGKKKSARQRKEAASWHAGWLMGCRNPSLHVAESIWLKNSPVQALAQIDRVLHTFSKQPSAAIEDLVEARLLSAAILRSICNMKVFDLCEEGLKICRDHDLPILSQKAQFQRGLCFLFLEPQYLESSLCFSLSEETDNSHAKHQEDHGT